MALTEEGSSLFLFLVIKSFASENMHSTGTLVAGIAKKSLAINDNFGYLIRFCFQNSD